MLASFSEMPLPTVRSSEPEDDEDEPSDEPCCRCKGDGRDPWNDYLLPCPLCQGEQTP